MGLRPRREKRVGGVLGKSEIWGKGNLRLHTKYLGKRARAGGLNSWGSPHFFLSTFQSSVPRAEYAFRFSLRVPVETVPLLPLILSLLYFTKHGGFRSHERR